MQSVMELHAGDGCIMHFILQINGLLIHLTMKSLNFMSREWMIRKNHVMPYYQMMNC